MSPLEIQMPVQCTTHGDVTGGVLGETTIEIQYKELLFIMINNVIL